MIIRLRIANPNQPASETRKAEIRLPCNRQFVATASAASPQPRACNHDIVAFKGPRAGSAGNRRALFLDIVPRFACSDLSPMIGWCSYNRSVFMASAAKSQKTPDADRPPAVDEFRARHLALA